MRAAGIKPTFWPVVQLAAFGSCHWTLTVLNPSDPCRLPLQHHHLAPGSWLHWIFVGQSLVLRLDEDYPLCFPEKTVPFFPSAVWDSMENNGYHWINFHLFINKWYIWHSELTGMHLAYLCSNFQDTFEVLWHPCQFWLQHESKDTNLRIAGKKIIKPRIWKVGNAYILAKWPIRSELLLVKFLAWSN